jgi:long-chain acyl-CoA synthetase
VLSADGWLRTGDIGTLDALGYLSLTDREKDMVVVNGFKVFPKQVEEALMQHEAVAEVLVVAGAHPYKGQVPYAFVTLNNKNDKVTPALLKQFAATRLNPLACPAEIFIRDSLPKTPLGKPCRKTLAAELAKMLGQQ